MSERDQRLANYKEDTAATRGSLSLHPTAVHVLLGDIYTKHPSIPSSNNI